MAVFVPYWKYCFLFFPVTTLLTVPLAMFLLLSDSQSNGGTKVPFQRRQSFEQSPSGDGPDGLGGEVSDDVMD